MISISHIISRVLKKLRGKSVVNTFIHRSVVIGSGSSVLNSTIARHSYCGYDCTILNCDIGSFCSIANNVSIGGATHPIGFVSTSPVFLSHKGTSVRTKFATHNYLPILRTIIGNDVWIGESVLIKAGVTIGDGVVIGMGSIVTKDVAPYTIVAGNPARFMRMRFEDDIVEALLKMKWWNLPDNELYRLGPVFNNPKAMLQQEGLL